MTFEIERRALLTKQEFERVKAYLDENARFLGRRTFASYLFREPGFLRIRIENKQVTITEKAGDYEDIGREERNTKIKYEKLREYLARIYKEGFKRCAEVSTERYSYEFSGVNVELNNISSLGLIAEIEALTEDEAKRNSLDKKIKETIRILGLKELPVVRYKKIMAKIYDNASKNTLEIS